MSSVVRVDEAYSAKLLRAIYDDAVHGRTTDFQIIVAGVTINCHRAVISAASTFFDTIVKTGGSQCILDQKIVKESQIENVKKTVQYLYTGLIHLNQDIVPDILQIANYLKLDGLSTACENFLVENLDSSNSIRSQRIAQKNNFRILQRESHKNICKSFQQVVAHQDFCGLSLEELKTYISDNELNLSSEDPVLDAVVKWIRHNENQNCAEELATHIRLPFCSQVKLNSLSKDKSVPQELRVEILTFLQHGEAPIQQPRRFFPGGLREYTVVLGGRVTGNVCNVDMWWRPIMEECWETLGNSKEQTEISFNSICHGEGKLYLSGGRTVSPLTSIKTLHQFNMRSKSWSILCDMPRARDRHTTLIVKGKLYVIGGQQTQAGTVIASYKEFDVLDLVSGVWTAGKAMPVSVQYALAVEVNSQILVPGGDIDDKMTTKVHKYSILQGTWTECQDMPSGTEAIVNSTIAVGKKCYMLGHNKFRCYNVITDAWTELAPPPRPSYWCSMILQHGRLVAKGGYEGKGKWESPHGDCQLYDISTDKWSIQKDFLPKPLCFHSSFVMYM